MLARCFFLFNNMIAKHDIEKKFWVLSARARARAPGPRMRGTSGPYPIRGLIICLPARAVLLAGFKILM